MRRETRIVMEETGDACPTCGGALRETFSPNIGFCVHCAKQVRIGGKKE